MTFKMAASWKRLRGELKPSNLKRYALDPGKTIPFMICLFVAECFVNVFVINKIKCEFSEVGPAMFQSCVV